MDSFQTVKQRMLKADGELQIILEYKPKARRQIETAIHHLELAIKAEGVDEQEIVMNRTPGRD